MHWQKSSQSKVYKCEKSIWSHVCVFWRLCEEVLRLEATHEIQTSTKLHKIIKSVESSWFNFKWSLIRPVLEGNDSTPARRKDFQSRNSFHDFKRMIELSARRRRGKNAPRFSESWTYNKCLEFKGMSQKKLGGRKIRKQRLAQSRRREKVH